MDYADPEYGLSAANDFQPSETYHKRAAMPESEDERSRGRIGGCLFCFIGTIVFFFGIFLCNRGAASNRMQEIYSYVRDVSLWRNSYGDQFKSLTMSIQTPENGLLPLGV